MATILGLDVSEYVVRGAVLKTAFRNNQIVRYLEVPIEPAEGAEAERAARVEAIRALMVELGPPPERIQASMPGAGISVRRVQLPSKAARKLDELLPFELDALVPFDPDDSILDHQLIAERDGMLELLAVVSPKEKVEARLAEFRDAGVDPRELDVGAVALDGLAGLVPALRVDAPQVLVHVERAGTDVCVIRNGLTQFARTLSVGLDDVDAGRGDLVARELRQSLPAWRVDGGDPPERIHLSGDLGAREGAEQWLAEILGEEVVRTALPPAAGADEAVRPTFARAVALAGHALSRTKHLDLRKGEFASRQAMTAIRHHLPLIAACGAVIVATFLFSSYAQYSVLAARQAQLADELSRVTEEHFGIAESSPAQALRMLERGRPANDPLPNFHAYHALAALSEAMPEDITHDVRQLQIDLGDGDETGRFNLRAEVDSIEDSERIQRALRDHRLIRREGGVEVRMRCFRDIELGPTSRAPEDRRSYRVEGSILCRPEDAPEPTAEPRRGARRGQEKRR